MAFQCLQSFLKIKKNQPNIKSNESLYGQLRYITSMWQKQLKLIFIPIAILFILAFVVFVINQVYQVYQLSSGINPTFGIIVLWTLSIVLLTLFSIPFYLFLKLPKPLKPRQGNIESFREKYFKRLRSNKFLKTEGIQLKNSSDLDLAIEKLNEQADSITKDTASSVFLTTAISQNGKLDALTVFITQSRMVWRIAHLYYQRPALRELTYLYANVGAATLLASEIEDIDISEQLEPVLKGFVKNSAGKAIPLIGPTANIIMDSLLEGSTNAFLTLRVGILAKRYCSSLKAIDPKKARRSAIREASGLMGALVFESSGKVVSALLKATKKVGVDSIKSSIGSLKKTVGKMTGRISKAKDKIVEPS